MWAVFPVGHLDYTQIFSYHECSDWAAEPALVATADLVFMMYVGLFSDAIHNSGDKCRRFAAPCVLPDGHPSNY